MAATKKKTAKKATAKAAKPTGVTKGSTRTTKSKRRGKAKAVGSSSNAENTTTSFPFLDLPAEIRNSVYELVLTSDETISVDEELTLPPLLASCTQIRDKASSIWYRDNNFEADIHGCDASALNKWAQHCCTVGQRDYFNVGIKLHGRIFWKNLVDWCAAVRKDDKARVFMLEEEMYEDERIVSEALSIAL